MDSKRLQTLLRKAREAGVPEDLVRTIMHECENDPTGSGQAWLADASDDDVLHDIVVHITTDPDNAF